MRSKKKHCSEDFYLWPIMVPVFPCFIRHVWFRVLWTFALSFLSPFGCKGSFVGDFGLLALQERGFNVVFSLHIV